MYLVYVPDSSIGKATRYALEDAGIDFWWGQVFSLPSRMALENN